MTEGIFITTWLAPLLITVTIVYACGCFYLMYKEQKRRDNLKK